jgi:hypothetical protein
MGYYPLVNVHSLRTGQSQTKISKSSNEMIHFHPFSTAGWWFGTCFMFPYIGNNHPNWLIFLRGVKTTNQIDYSQSATFAYDKLWESKTTRRIEWPSQGRLVSRAIGHFPSSVWGYGVVPCGDPKASMAHWVYAPCASSMNLPFSEVIPVHFRQLIFHCTHNSIRSKCSEWTISSWPRPSGLCAKFRSLYGAGPRSAASGRMGDLSRLRGKGRWGPASMWCV